MEKSACILGLSVLFVLALSLLKTMMREDTEQALPAPRLDRFSTEIQRSEYPTRQELGGTRQNLVVKPLDWEGSDRPAPKDNASPPRQIAADISVNGDHLTINVVDCALKPILHEVSQKTGIPITVSDEIGNPSISIQFHDFSLDQGLQFLLKDYDSFFLYSPTEEGLSELKTLWVYPKGRGQNLAPVPAEQWASTIELEQNLTSMKADDRTQAIEALVKR